MRQDRRFEYEHERQRGAHAIPEERGGRFDTPGKRTRVEMEWREPAVSGASPGTVQRSAAAAPGAALPANVEAHHAPGRPTLDTLFGDPRTRAVPAAPADPVHEATSPSAAPAVRDLAMPSDLLARFAASFGQSFAGVAFREDAGPNPYGALAYTRGDEIRFAPGVADPASERGRALIGHELTHVVQQRAGGVAVAQGKAATSSVHASPALEREADVLGLAAAAGRRVHVTGVASASHAQCTVNYPLKEGATNPPTWSIPTGDASQEIAKKLVGELEKLGPRALKPPKSDDDPSVRAKVRTRDRSDGYMIGVVILANGSIWAAASGSVPDAFEQACALVGARWVRANVPTETARDIVLGALPPGAQGNPETGAVTVDHHGRAESGQAAGRCAGSKLIWAIVNKCDAKPREMTEVFFSPEHSPASVEVYDAHDHSQHYGHGDVVPSCVTCQVFIAEQLKEFEVRLAKLAQARDEEERERARLRAEAEDRQRQAREAEDKRRAIREAEERVVKMSEQHEQLEKLVAELRSLLLTASKAKSTKQTQPTITAAKSLLEDVRVSLDNYLNINENTIHPKRHADASAVMKELVKEFQKYA